MFRWTYIEFYSRYGVLMTRQELAAGDKKRVCVAVLHRLIQVPADPQGPRAASPCSLLEPGPSCHSSREAALGSVLT